MKNIFLLATIVGFLSACHSDNNSDKKSLANGVHTAVVEEVLQTSQYTYLHVKEGENEPWLALPKMQAAAGETYYYKGGLPMNDFESKELNRKFDEILFLDVISTNPDNFPKSTGTVTSDSNAKGNETKSPDENKTGETTSTSHTVVAEEVLQTSKYTYIRGKEDDKEIWLAVSKMEATVGNSYSFKGGLPMTDFVSKELKKTFKDILFVDNIESNSSRLEKDLSSGSEKNATGSKGSAIDIEKKNISISHAKDDVTIAKLYENKKSYDGKSIKLKGQVTKINNGIMNKNWIHLQDGTEFSGKFDLTVTTDQEVELGDKITVEGMITLNKDFGYGYFYDVMMEDAKISK